MSDDELESPLQPSDPETQFVPQDDDEETLWEVIEITSEKGKLYRVRWKGNDPKTQKPWPQSWVPKHDCTDDLVRSWKLRQAKKRKASKRESGVSKKSRTSFATVKSTVTPSPSKLDSADSTRRSTSTTTAVTARRGRTKVSISTPSVHNESTRSRKHVETYSPSPLSYKSPSRSAVDATPTPTNENLELDSSSNANFAASTPTVSTKIRTKRKHGETTSTTTSARISAGAEGAARTNRISGSIPPPRKKRKLEVEPVKNHEHSMQEMTSSDEVDKKRRKRKTRTRAIDDDGVGAKTKLDGTVEPEPEPSEPQHRKSTSPSQAEVEEADERMIEETLSDFYHSPHPGKPLAPNYDQENERTPTPPVRAQGAAHRRKDAVEESPTVSRPQREMSLRVDSPPAYLARTTLRKSKPNPPSMITRPSAPPSSSAAALKPISLEVAPTTKFRIMTQAVRSKAATGAKNRMKTATPKHPFTVSKQKWEELNDFQSQQVEEPSEKNEGPNLDTDLDFPVVELSPLPSKLVSNQVSRSGADSGASSGSHSLTKRIKSIPLPPSKRASSSSSASSSVGIVIPTTSSRNKEVDGDDEDGHRSPILSPGAKERLEQFDKSMMEIASIGKGKGKDKEQQSDVVAILGKVEKGRKREGVRDEGVAVLGGRPNSDVEPSIKSDDNANARSETKWKSKDSFRYMPRTKPMADTEDEAEDKQDSSSSTRAGATGAKPTDTSTAVYKNLSKTISKPQSEDVTQATQGKPPPHMKTTTVVRRSANPRSNSFVDDVIPETEESSQEKVSLQVPPVPPATPSTKSTLKSRMKPKTPQPKSRALSRTSSAVSALALGIKLNMDVGVAYDADEKLEDAPGNVGGADELVKKTSTKKTHEIGTTTTKPFGPIPRISPSTFKAHLPASSLPDSIVDSIEGEGDDAVKRTTHQSEEDDSIEQFESPVKELGGERKIGVLNAASRQGREKQLAKESASDIWNSDINRRGQELAEVARRKRERENLHVEEANPDISMKSLPPDVILPPKDTNSVVQKMEDAYVDLSGGIRDDQITAPASTSAIAGVEESVEVGPMVESNDIDLDDTGIVERQLNPIQEEEESQDLLMEREEEEESTQDLLVGQEEEEESTQDLLMEPPLYQQQQAFEVEQSGDLVTDTSADVDDLPPSILIESQPIIDSMLDDAQERDADHNDIFDRFMDEVPSIFVEKPSRDPSARSYSPPEDHDEPSCQKARSRTPRSRSRSPLSSQNSKNVEPDPEAEIPATASTHRESLQVSSQSADSQTESVENPHHLGAAMHLLNAKSEEISKLEGQLSAAQGMNEELLQQLSALRLQLAEKQSTAVEQELAETRAEFALQKASWENERMTLVLNVETATRGKVSAEQDRDFFREQYAKSSAFVTSVRDENSDLEERIKIATEQAQSGVSLIKNTFELRTKSLEEDVRAWRKMAEFLIEKDRRTNDDIRRRAAEEPELRAMCDRRDGALEEASERLTLLELELEEKQRMYVEAEEAGKKWKEATVKLNLELSEAKMKLERIGKIGAGESEGSLDSLDHEFVYRCQWRPNDSNDSCEAIFLNISELQEHLFTGGHLQRD